MKICLECDKSFATAGWRCPACEYVPPKCDGFYSFAPEMALEGGGNDPEYFKDIARLDSGNFWFTARNPLFIWMIKKYFRETSKILEIGCGTAFVLSAIERAFPEVELYGSEIFSAGLAQSKKRVKKATLFQMDARRIPFENEFDLIMALDVLEHIKEDNIALSEMYRAVKKGGGILVAVPQHPSLWSKFDEQAYHERRYTLRELKEKIETAGFKVLRSTSFFTSLLPAFIIKRYAIRNANPDYDLMDDIKVGRVTNFILEKILNFETLLIRAGISLPIGSSLIIIAEK